MTLWLDEHWCLLSHASLHATLVRFLADRPERVFDVALMHPLTLAQVQEAMALMQRGSLPWCLRN